MRLHVAHFRRLPRGSDLRLMVALEISDTLIRVRCLDRAERWLCHQIARPEMTRASMGLQGSVRHELGRLYRLNGWLTMASARYRDAARHQPLKSFARVSNFVSLAHSELRSDHLAGCREALSLVPDAIPVGTERESYCRWLHLAGQLSLAIECGDAPAAKSLLAAFEAVAMPPERVRDHLLVRNYRADVDLLAGDIDRAETEYASAFDETQLRARSMDLAACFARGLAECHLAKGEYEQAIDRASYVVRASVTGDRLEWLIALRLQAEAHWHLGRHAEARELFQRAIAGHIDREFVRERARLDACLQRLGVAGVPVGTPVTSPGVHARDDASPAVHEMRLEDGGRFLTSEGELVRQIARAARSGLPVLIEGETGTGKELVARLLHERGLTPGGAFVIVDCTMLSEAAADEWLFGSARPAAPGIATPGEGLVAQADGGTLLLDELSALPLATQAHLLRFVQDGSYRRVGERTTRRSDARVLATTNHRIAVLLESGQLKADLFHRLNGHRIQLPPLRERREDIPGLAQELALRCGVAGVSREAGRELVRHDWPGNVRELELRIRTAAAALEPGESIEVEHLRLAGLAAPASGNPPGLRERRLAVDRAGLQEALAAANGNKTAAARALGMTRQGLYKALRRAQPQPGT